MDQYIEKGGKKLRLGYTTGSCATAAAKAACMMLLTGREKSSIMIETPKGIDLNLEVLDIKMEADKVSCAIRKDSGDDPDITKGTLIYAEVAKTSQGITIDGGKGVGRVTKRGLDQPAGNAAINSVPRKMIEENVREVCEALSYEGGISVIVSVPEGEELARKTMNPRLGIEGGISILGTSGIVEPMSEQALVDTIRVELTQRRTLGHEYVLLTPGNYGADYIKEHVNVDLNKAVLVSNFIGEALDICKSLGFKGALLIGHVGKLVKIAGGMLNTHSKYGDCRMEIMASNAGACGLNKESIDEMLQCVTCDDGIRILKENNLCEETLERIEKRIEFILKHRADEMEIGAVVFSKVYGELCRTQDAEKLLDLIREE